MKANNRYTVDIEIPRFFITVPITADNWIDVLTQAASIKPKDYIKIVNKAEWRDSDKIRISSICHQD